MIVRCNDGDVKDCYLAIEKQIICKVEIRHAVFILFASFYVFNVNYPDGCSNVYLLLELLFFKKKVVGRKPRLAAILAELTC